MSRRDLRTVDATPPYGNPVNGRSRRRFALPAPEEVPAPPSRWERARRVSERALLVVFVVALGATTLAVFGMLLYAVVMFCKLRGQ